jgi:hypothetical protein
MELYCGNNLNYPPLQTNNAVIGSRYDCFQKGVGIGLGQPLDPNYAVDYRPIDNRKIYCGKRNTLLPNYNYIGNSPQCLQKGVGVGKHQRMLGGHSPNSIIRNILIGSWILISIIFFTLIILLKSRIIFDTDSVGEKKINHRKLLGVVGVYFIISLVLILTLTHHSF